MSIATIRDVRPSELLSVCGGVGESPTPGSGPWQRFDSLFEPRTQFREPE